MLLKEQLFRIGEIENKGVEVSISTRNLVGDFKWNTNLNISSNKNMVKDFFVVLELLKELGNISFLSRSLNKNGIQLLYFHAFIGLLIDIRLRSVFKLIFEVVIIHISKEKNSYS